MTIRPGMRSLLAALVVLGSLAGVSCAGPAQKTPQPTTPAVEASHPQLARALGRAGLFSGLTSDEKAALASAATVRQGKEGERIIEQGKPLAKMYVILEGDARVIVNGSVVATLPAQSLVGEVEFLDKKAASADVVVSGDTALIELDDAALTKLMDARPEIGYVLMSRIAKLEGARLRAMDEKQ